MGSEAQEPVSAEEEFRPEIQDGDAAGWIRRVRHREDVMRSMRLVLMGLLLTLPFGLKANAQWGVGIGIGPEVVPAPEYYGPPVCEWGYYPYYPYDCAPYGYYGPDWFYGGVFIGAGPWYNRGWYGRGWGRGGYGYGGRGGYGYGGRGLYAYGNRGSYGYGNRGGYASRAPYAGNGYRAYGGGTARAFGGMRSYGSRGGSYGFRGGGGGGFRGGGGGFRGGGGGFHGGGGGHGGGGHR